MTNPLFKLLISRFLSIDEFRIIQCGGSWIGNLLAGIHYCFYFGCKYIDQKVFIGSDQF